MSRRRRATSRVIDPDPKFGSLVLAKFINKVMLNGKKSTAQRMVYGALEKLAQKAKINDAIEAFEAALNNSKPSLEVKSRRIGGATYQVPVEIPPARQLSLAMRWIIGNSRNRPGKSMEDALSLELLDCFNNQGTTIKKKEDTHKMAEANKAFAHFKW
jgi:small subunit ribosomal protein S7